MRTLLPKTNYSALLFILFLSFSARAQEFDLTKPLPQIESDMVSYYYNKSEFGPIKRSIIHLLKSGKAKGYKFTRIRNMASRYFSLVESDDQQLTVFVFPVEGPASAAEEVYVFNDGKQYHVRQVASQPGQALISRINRIKDLKNIAYLLVNYGYKDDMHFVRISSAVIADLKIQFGTIRFDFNGKVQNSYVLDVSYLEDAPEKWLTKQAFDSWFKYRPYESLLLPSFQQGEDPYPVNTGQLLVLKYENLKFTQTNQVETSASRPKSVHKKKETTSEIIISPSTDDDDDDENRVFEKVEIEASVNPPQWRRHLENQLQRYIEDAANAGMAPGNYTVNVRFLVEKDGSITDVRALNDPGYGLAAGAVEVVKRGPKWSPGEQNGKKVRSYHTQPISFMIAEE